ncbi:hypothetical protein PHYBLDRAFT_100373, partial [Phycomyces blakesleeanus NRRL 1555(-)]
NLPCNMRFKKENIILVGLMPGSKEASKSDINNYLKPPVDELELLYKGMNIRTHQHPEGIPICTALFMVACDIPAARKVCGFTSHTSTNACHKCNRKFTWLNGTSSVGCTKEENRRHANLWKNAKTLTERKRLEIENGVRWSELHRLVYFEPVHATIIDPMHNLFLGTAK